MTRKKSRAAAPTREDSQSSVDSVKPVTTDEFLAMVAHELRTPLAALRNALQILKEPVAAAAMIDQARDIMEHQIQNMSRMINDLLDVSRMTQRRIQLHKEPVELITVLERAVEANRHHIQARDQVLTLALPPDPVYAEADALRLEQIFSNLLNNASKFTERRGHLSLTAARASGTEQIVIRVRDRGIGIDPAVLPRIFEPFMQAKSSGGGAEPGVGIGLTLVRHLVALHGGRIEALSGGLGHGSEFVVRLPVLPEAASRASRETPPTELPPRSPEPSRSP